MRPVLLGILLLLLSCAGRPDQVVKTPPTSSAIVQADAQATHVADLGKRIEAEKIAAVEASVAADVASKAGDTKAADAAKADADRHAALAKLFHELREQDKSELEALKQQAKKEAADKAEADKKEAAALALQASINRVRTIGLSAAGIGALIALAAGIAGWYYAMMRGIFTCVSIFGGCVAALGITAAMLAPSLAYSELISQIILGVGGLFVVIVGVVGARFLWLHHATHAALADYGHLVEDLVPDKDALKAIKDKFKDAKGSAQVMVAEVVSKSKERLRV